MLGPLSEGSVNSRRSPPSVDRHAIPPDTPVRSLVFTLSDIETKF